MRSKIFLFATLILGLTLMAQAENLQVGGSTRNMIVYAPSGIPADRPLIISLHGMNQDAPFQQNSAKWEPIADTAKFVVVFPNGNNKSWDISGNKDIDFILAIIDSMSDRYKIDRNRVYVSGFSMGGMMSYHVANKIADKVAAIAPVSGYLFNNTASSSRPMPIIHTHGTSDDVVNYSGVAGVLSKWRTHNSCPSNSTTIKPYPASKPGSAASRDFWGPCKNSDVALITISGKGHWYSTDEASVHTSVEIWNFVKNYSLAGNTPVEPPAPPIPEHRDTVYNGSFDSTDAGWKLNVWDGSASGKVVNGEYQISIASIGTENYQIQLIQPGIILQKGKSYELNFDAYASANRSLEIKVEKDTDPWTMYLQELKTVNLTSTKKTYTVQFTMEEETDSTGRISFNAGASTESIFLDNISIKEIDKPTTSILANRNDSETLINITNSQLSIDFLKPLSQSISVSIYNMMGTKLKTQSLLTNDTKQSMSFSTENMPNGMYFIQIQQAGKLIQSSKVLILN